MSQLIDLSCEFGAMDLNGYTYIKITNVVMNLPFFTLNDW